MRRVIESSVILSLTAVSFARNKKTHTYISRMYLCVLHDRHIVRSANVWTMANSDPMNKDQNVCTAIVPSLVTKSTVKCDYGLSQITIERWNFSHRRSNNFSTCLSDNVWKISPIINSDFKTNRQRLGLLLSVFLSGRNFDVKIIKHSYFYNIFLRIKFNFHNKRDACWNNFIFLNFTFRLFDCNFEFSIENS